MKRDACTVQYQFAGNTGHYSTDDPEKVSWIIGKFKPGRPIQVRYLESAPWVSIPEQVLQMDMTAAQEKKRTGWKALLRGLVPLGIWVISYWVILPCVATFLRWRKELKLARNGIVIPAVVGVVDSESGLQSYSAASEIDGLYNSFKGTRPSSPKPCLQPYEKATLLYDPSRPDCHCLYVDMELVRVMSV